MAQSQTATQQPSSDPIRVLVADDHGIVRLGLRSLIAGEPDLELVGEAGDGAETISKVQQLQPDVAVLDIEMPNMTGIEVIRRLRETSPKTRVLILTMHNEPGLVRSAVAAGSAGYVVKDGVASELVQAIRTVYRGSSYLKVNLGNVQLQEALGMKKTSRDPGILSTREREVLGLLARGYTNREAAQRLHLSHKTVGTYRHRLSEKLGLKTRAEIVKYASEAGLLDTPQEE